jgi:hypothetical protein
MEKQVITVYAAFLAMNGQVIGVKEETQELLKQYFKGTNLQDLFHNGGNHISGEVPCDIVAEAILYKSWGVWAVYEKIDSIMVKDNCYHVIKAYAAYLEKAWEIYAPKIEYEVSEQGAMQAINARQYKKAVEIMKVVQPGFMANRFSLQYDCIASGGELNEWLQRFKTFIQC